MSLARLCLLEMRRPLYEPEPVLAARVERTSNHASPTPRDRGTASPKALFPRSRGSRGLHRSRADPAVQWSQRRTSIAASNGVPRAT